jgi:hypothetical protein
VEWYKPKVDHFKVFGCLAYVHIPEQKRGKLDDKTEKAIFIGYSENSKAYKLYNPITKKTIISRDVIFNEDENWTKNGKTGEVPYIHEFEYENQNQQIEQIQNTNNEVVQQPNNNEEIHQEAQQEE